MSTRRGVRTRGPAGEALIPPLPRLARRLIQSGRRVQEHDLAGVLLQPGLEEQGELGGRQIRVDRAEWAHSELVQGERVDRTVVVPQPLCQRRSRLIVDCPDVHSPTEYPARGVTAYRWFEGDSLERGRKTGPTARTVPFHDQ